MKFVIAAVAIALATPALADKQPIKPVVKPVQTECSATITALQEQILMMKKQLAAAQVEHKPTFKPGQKPVDLLKKS